MVVCARVGVVIVQKRFECTCACMRVWECARVHVCVCGSVRVYLWVDMQRILRFYTRVYVSMCLIGYVSTCLCVYVSTCLRGYDSMCLRSYDSMCLCVYAFLWGCMG